MLFLVIQTCLFYCATHTTVELPQAKVVSVLCVLCMVVTVTVTVTEYLF
jgi:hypothetical protein